MVTSCQEFLHHKNESASHNLIIKFVVLASLKINSSLMITVCGYVVCVLCMLRVLYEYMCMCEWISVWVWKLGLNWNFWYYCDHLWIFLPACITALFLVCFILCLIACLHCSLLACLLLSMHGCVAVCVCVCVCVTGIINTVRINLSVACI